MIKFFRNIRRKLITSGNVNRYLLYAVGEIFLVMIGILLALQVNNWNEQEKLKKYEIASLKNIKSDLLVSQENLISCNFYDSLAVQQILVILDYIENKKPYQDTLKENFSRLLEWATPTFNTGAYESLKSSKGLDVITNDSLREQITYLHETRYSINLDRYDKEEAMVHQELMLPIFSDLFNYYYNPEEIGAIPVDYEALFENQKFINVLRITKKYRIGSFFAERHTLDLVNKLINDITLEIKRLEN